MKRVSAKRLAVSEASCKNEMNFLDPPPDSQKNKSLKDSDSSVVPLEGVTQFQVLFSSVAVLFVMLTFFVSTSLWVYAEPILSLYLKDEFNIADWAAPLFFLVFSLGYLAASLVMFLTKISKMAAYKLSSTAFVITGICHSLLLIKIENNYTA